MLQRYDIEVEKARWGVSDDKPQGGPPGRRKETFKQPLQSMTPTAVKRK